MFLKSVDNSGVRHEKELSSHGVLDDLWLGGISCLIASKRGVFGVLNPEVLAFTMYFGLDLRVKILKSIVQITTLY